MATKRSIDFPVFKAAYAKVLAQVAVDSGINLYRLLDAAKLPTDLLLSDDTFVPTESVRRMIYLMSAELGVDKYVKALRNTIKQKLLTNIVSVFAAYKTIDQALTSVNQVFLQDSPSNNVRFETEYDQSWLCVYPAGGMFEHTQWAEAFAVIYIEELISELLNETWRAKSVKIKSSNTNAFDGVVSSNCKLFIEHKCIAVWIPKQVLAHQLAKEAFTPSIEPVQVEWHSSFIDTAFELLRPYVRESDLTVEFAAQLLNLTVRTFQRRLQQEGTSFRKFKDNLMFSVASELIASGHSLTYISNQLGYASPSLFSRAFKRVSGVAPKHYKQAQLQGN